MNSVHAKRLLSLDAFRGLTIAAMILVNSPGTYRAVYPQLRHAEWNGWTFTDTIFPAFLFIMGISTVFSLAAGKERGVSDYALDLQIVKRTLLLFALGLFINSYPIFHLSTMRIPGVLQRIALCYLFTCIIIRSSNLKGRVFWLGGLLTSYWILMFYVPTPDIGAGVLEPGRNFAAYIDSLFLSGHMWTHYETWDPEGLIGTIPAIATTLFGVLTGDLLRSPLSDRAKTTWMLFAAAMLLALGAVLNQWLPINKNIWTSTFSIFMAGLSLLVLAPFYWIIDAKGYRRWAVPFVIFGVNSIAIYFLSEVLDTSLRFVRLSQPGGGTISLRAYVYWTCFAPLAKPENASLIFAIVFVLAMFVIAWAMWKKRLFIKV
ncbi:MAG: heparan-alpha-glucosaminide N-acetyltransferase domain-containing protein [Syntrophobacteraceae bacterium]